MERALDGEVGFVLIDDLGGQRLVALAQRYLRVQRASSPSIGDLKLVTTEVVLRSQAKTSLIPDRGVMRAIYQQMRAIDDGLIHIDQTTLLQGKHWARARHLHDDHLAGSAHLLGGTG